jgi:hypothetical protein
VSLALAAVVAALAAAPPPPAAAERPTAAVPIVVGGYGITRGHLRHWTDLVAHASGRADRRKLRAQAAGLLISYRWVGGEAAERGLRVAPAEVLQAFREQRDQAFPRRREYRRFLRDSGQTRANLLFRVRHQLLSDRVREQVVGDAPTPEEQQARLDAFVQAFNAKWRARTACLPPWADAFHCQPTARSRGDATPSARTRFLPSAFAR